MSEAEKSVRRIERTQKGSLLLLPVYVFLFSFLLGVENSSADKDPFPAAKPLPEEPIRVDAMRSYKACPLDLQTRLLATGSRMCFWPHSRRWNCFVMIAHESLSRYPVPERMLVSIRKQSKTL